MPWFQTPFGPQYVVEPGTVDEYERRDYTQLTAQQAADYYTGVAIPEVGWVSEGELPGKVAAAVTAGTGALPEALRAVFGPGAIVDGAANGTTDDRAAINTAATAAAGAGGAMLLRRGTYRVASNLTVAVPVVIQPGAVIKPDNGVTVTLAGGVDAGLHRLADHSAGGLVVPMKVETYHPAWWGPTGTSDDTATWSAMLAANAACQTSSGKGNRVRLPQGESRIWNLTAAYVAFEAGVASSRVLPAGAPTSGSMLTLGNQTSISGGEWSSGGNAGIKVLDVRGVRTLIEKAYVRPLGAGTVGISAFATSGASITPKIANTLIFSDGTGTGVSIDTPDAELTNVWVGSCDTGMYFFKGQATVVACHVWGCTTMGVKATDGSRYNSCYFETNGGWGVEASACDRTIFDGCYFWKNGQTIANTGGIRIFAATASRRDNILSNCLFDDNTGVGVLIDGAAGTRVIGTRFGSSQVQGGGAAITTYGIRVTAGSTRTRLDIQGRASDVVTALILDEALDTDIDLGRFKRVQVAPAILPTDATYATLHSLPLVAGDKWLITGFLMVDGPQAADVRLRIVSFDATNISGWYGFGPAPATTTTSATAGSVLPQNARAITTASTAIAAGLGGEGVVQAIPFFAYVNAGSVAGNLQVRAAQNVADVGLVTVSVSSIEATRLP